MQGVDAYTTLTCQNRNDCWVNVRDVYNLQGDSACVTFHTGRRFSVKYRVIHLLKHRRSSLQLFWQLASNSTTLQTSKLTACLINYCVHLKAPRHPAQTGMLLLLFSLPFFFLVIFLRRRTGCCCVEVAPPNSQIVVQVFWTSSWLAFSSLV